MSSSSGIVQPPIAWCTTPAMPTTLLSDSIAPAVEPFIPASANRVGSQATTV